MRSRTGLRIRTNKIDSELAHQFKNFAVWLRKKYDFPIRVPVYLSAKKYVMDRNGEKCVSIFFAPFDNKVEPYIRIATGDYEELVEEIGKENAVLNILFSLALNIIKYQKWIDNNLKLDAYNAENDANRLFQNYIDSTFFNL